MPTNWDAIDQGITDAARKTDDTLAAKVSAATTLTADEIRQLFPNQADVKKLAQLMSVVKGASDANEKTAALIANIGDLAGTVITLLSKKL